MGADEMTTAHMKIWLECLCSRKQPHAPVCIAPARKRRLGPLAETLGITVTVEQLQA